MPGSSHIFQITGGQVLLDSGELAARTVIVGADGIADVAKRPYPGVPAYEADGLLVLPGIVDLHGDGFERSIMPRPGIAFALPMALVETDRLLAGNGITTGYLGLTCSWEPGLRSTEAAARFLDALAETKPQLNCDVRLHLRWETSNLEAVEQALAWVADGRVDLLAFNDHIDDLLDSLPDPAKLGRLAGRCGIAPQDYRTMVEHAAARREQVPASTARLAEAARRAGIPVAAHDNNSPADWAASRALGCTICEFPADMETAEAALADGAATVMGAPNVLRGGSHCGRLSVADAVRAGLCSSLTTDYYYPALIQAAFHLAQNEGALPDIWPLLSSGPANAAGLTDRGRICAGLRADLVLVDAKRSPFPQVVGTFVDGMLAFAARALHAPAGMSIGRGLTAAQ